MMNTRSINLRVGILLTTLALLAIGSIPLIGMAQDSTPVDDRAAAEQLAYGEAIYTNVCIACHQPDGNGIQNIYLPLNNNPLLTGEDPTYFISTVLTGRGGMPAFAGLYTDEEIAAVISYVRQAWDNDAPPVSAEEVAAIRVDLYGTPSAEGPEATPFGQRPSGDVSASPESSTFGSPEASPDATPE